MAVYYFVPHKVLKFDRLEDPQSMDKIMSILGANPIDWAFKTECCGAGLSVSRTDLVGRLSGNILKDASDRGAGSCHCGLSDVSFQFGYASFYDQQAFDGTDDNTCAICNSSVRIGYRTFS